MNETNAERIDRTLEELLEYHRSVHDMASQIGHLVESEDGDGAVRKLTERMHRLQRLRPLHEELKALMLIERVHLVEPDDRDRLEHYQSVGKRLASWVESTLSIDAENECLLREAKRELSNRLSRIERSKRQVHDRRYHEQNRKAQGMSLLG